MNSSILTLENRIRNELMKYNPKYGLLLAVLLFFQIAVSAQELGTWRDYFSYANAIDVSRLNDQVYVATPNAIFIYDISDNSTERINKVNGLSDINISAIESNSFNNTVLVGYENGNLDVIRNRQITNFTAIRNSSVTGDKAIRHILFRDNLAYLSTGVGVIVYNVDRNEVSDTYGIIPTGALSVNKTTILNDTLFAATNEGLFAGSLQNDLTIFSNWAQDLSIPEPFEEVHGVASHAGKLFINMRESDEPGVYLRDGTWLVLTPGDSFSIESSPGGVTITAPWVTLVQDETGLQELFRVQGYPFDEVSPRISTSYVDGEGNMWIADSFRGLVWRNTQGSLQEIRPEGPARNDCFDLNYQDGTLWVASGAPSHPGTWNNSFLMNGFYRFENGEWLNVIREYYPQMETFHFFDATMGYKDRFKPNTSYLGSLFGGMVVLEGDEIIAHYDENNSSLDIRQVFPEFVGVAGFAQDNEGNLWITNSHADEPLSVFTPEGEWRSFSFQGALGNNTLLTDVIIARDGAKWMVRNRGGVAVFKEGDSFDDYDVHVFGAGSGNGGLPVAEVYCLAEDLDGEIWVGTDDGVAVFYSPFDALSNDPSDARQILVEQDGIFQFLLEAQPISTITIDGANRKWIGTFGSGIFLLSEDGTEQISRFTTENSPLPSDEISDIVIDPVSGEVFIGTPEGIISYIGDATAGSNANECNKVFPNPVRETYSGPISITGLMRDSEVRITDVRGNLIASATSQGGSAVWDGTNLNGERVATGVYFALVSDGTGDSTCVTKILVVK
jgi:hypothetical protein